MAEISFIWLVSVILGGVVLSGSHKAGIGMLLGAILGPVGVLVAFVIRRSESKKEERRLED
jgi:hypothetical protein